jgi:DNA-binding transcriptional regulator YdaS (Cro superfamily)
MTIDIQEAFDTSRGMRIRVAKALKITHGAVSQWKRVPAERVLTVEKVTGIPRHLLRPDIYPAPAAHEAVE